MLNGRPIGPLIDQPASIRPTFFLRNRVLKIIHVSDIHFWRYSWNPFRLMGKRLFGSVGLAVGRARRFRLERVADLVERVTNLNPDHLLITGDLTTLALPAEFAMARRALEPWLREPEKVTVIPGNHDRYTLSAQRGRLFERQFGAYAPAADFPWIRKLDNNTIILGLDPTRAGLSASGLLPGRQLVRARQLIEATRNTSTRMIVACHYPVAVPEEFARDYAKKPLNNAASIRDWLRTIGPHLYCCGHVHCAWAFRPIALPNELCLNAGAPLLRDPHARRPPGFLEIDIDQNDVVVTHHGHTEIGWQVHPLSCQPGFFAANPGV
jgi:3',5'-cyclic AMP phosphodiesterase CpdA